MKEGRLKKLLQENRFYLELLNRLPEHIYIYDEQGRFVFLNRAAEKFEHHRLEDVMGKHINELYVQDYSPSLKALETRKPVIDSKNVYIINGKQCIQDTRAYPIMYGDELVGVYTIEIDLTSLEEIVSDNLKYQKENSATSVKGKSRTFDTLIGKDESFLRCIELGKIAAANDSSVMLSGYTGSGKEMFARSIHNASARKDGPFMAVNCAAIPETLLESILFGTTKGSFTGAVDKSGVFEQARGGTLFLDEVNSMSLNSQAKLLRVLEEKELTRLGGSTNIKTDVHIISSINTVPKEAVESGQLRSDLFYRLSVISIIIPKLSARKEDIRLMTDFFLKKFSTRFGKSLKDISPEVEAFFMRYSWPGNVRQLKYVLESAASMASPEEVLLKMEHLPQYITDDPDTERDVEVRKSDDGFTLYRGMMARDEVTEGVPEGNVFEEVRKKEINEIKSILYRCGGNVSKTAREMGIHRQSLIYKMKKYGITRENI